MTLRLHDRWIWDFWLVSDGGVHHVFYLQAPRSIEDPHQRHWNVSIGHAISSDLQRWQPVEDALAPGPPGAFDDYTTWTGSIVRFKDEWAMLYTGANHAEKGLVQRVGLATSADLYEWDCDHKAVLVTDPERYETLNIDIWHDQAWRDPWLVTFPNDPRMHALLTARSNTGDRFDRGVIGHACSDNLRDWDVLDPLVSPQGFGQLEVPQLIQLGQHWYLLFCSDYDTQSPQRQQAATGTGTYYMIADSAEGPFEMIGNGVLAADLVGSSYAGRIHLGNDGDPWFLAWDRTNPDGSFVGQLGAARRVRIRDDGSLKLDEPRSPR